MLKIVSESLQNMRVLVVLVFVPVNSYLVKNSFVHFRLLRFAIGKTGIELKIN